MVRRYDAKLADEQSRDARVATIVGDVIRRRNAGENLADEQVLGWHPDLAQELSWAFRNLSRIEEAERLAHSTSVPESGAGDIPPWLTASIPTYKIRKLLARGGQAAVYLATHVRTNREVAIKVMRESSFFGPSEVARFEQEATVLGRLENPNIVAVHDSGTASGCPYFVMDYVVGTALDEYVRKHLLSVEGVLRLFVSISRTVHAAHLRGVIHRDLKPSNIIIDESGQPHILDFGLAKVSAEGISDRSKWHDMTMTGQFIGSLPWASPEQVEGSPDHVDLRTDVYSLGVMLYQMLTSEFPYDVTGYFRSVTFQIVSAEPHKPSAIQRTIDEDVDIIVLKCLAKDPDDRYPSVITLTEDIEHYLRSEPIQARAPSTAYQLKKLIGRHKLRFIVGCVATMLVVFFSLVMTVLYSNASSAEQHAEQARTRAEREATTVTAIKQFLVDDLFESASPRVARGEDVMVREILQEASKRVPLAFADQPELRAAILSTLGSVHLSLGLYSQAEEQLREAAKIFEAQLGADHIDTLHNASLLVQALRRGGDLAAAREMGEDRLAAARRALGDDHRVTLDLADALTVVYAMLDKLDDAAELAQQTLTKRRSLLGDDHPDTIKALNQVGMILTPYAARSWEVEGLFQEAVANARRVLGDDHPETLNAMVHLGAILRDQRRFEEAEPLLKNAYAGLKRVVGDEHPALLFAMRDYALLLKEEGRVDESLDLTRDAVKLACNAFGNKHHWALELRYYLGTDFLRSGCISEAAETLGTLSADSFRVRGETHHSTVDCLDAYSFALLQLGNYDEAEKGLRRSLQILRGAGGEVMPHAMWCLRLLVATLAAQGKQEQARPFAEHLLALRRINAADVDADAWRLNSYAWELLTVYPLDLRDPQQALEVALKGYQRSSDEYHYNRYTVALAYEANGLIDEAIRFAKLALAHSPIENSSERADYERLLVRLYQNKGQGDDAEAVYRNVLSARRERFGDFHEDVASALFGLASLLADHGKATEAEETLRECLSIREVQLESPADLSCPTTTTCLTMETLVTLGELLESHSRLSEAQEFVDRALTHLARGEMCPRRTIERVEELNARVASRAETP